jgi:site-specific DNA recombinase
VAGDRKNFGPGFQYYFTRLVRLSCLAPDITQAILDGRQPRDLSADKLLAHSRLPLTWHEQRTVLGFG